MSSSKKLALIALSSSAAHRARPAGAVTRRGRRASSLRSRGSDAGERRPATSGTVAFLGLGAMGRPDGRAPRRVRLRRARLQPHARTGEGAREARRDRRARRRESARSGADVVITMLSDAEALASVLEGTRRRARHVRERSVGSRDRCSSTCRRSDAAPRSRAGRRAEEHGARFVDAPVSGSVRPAGTGELRRARGRRACAPSSACARSSPSLCKKVIHAGGIGQGQALKVVLNGVGAHHLVAFTSMLALGERAGLARDVLLDAFTTGAFATPSYIGKRDKVLARDYTRRLLARARAQGLRAQRRAPGGGRRGASRAPRDPRATSRAG